MKKQLLTNVMVNRGNFIIHKVKYIIGALTALCFIVSSSWGKDLLLKYSSFINNSEKYIYYLIETNKNKEINFTVLNQDNKMEKISYYPDFRLDKQTTYNSNGERILEVSYNPESNKIKLSGIYNVQYDMRTNLLDQNNTLGFQFSHYLPNTGTVFNFNLLLSMNNRIVGMYLKEIGEEVLDILGKKENTIKYELGLNGAMESSFWPYKYYYWYRSKDNLFVKYEGPEDNKSTNIVILKNIENR